MEWGVCLKTGRFRENAKSPPGTENGPEADKRRTVPVPVREKRSGRWDAKYRFCLRQGGDETVWLCQAAGVKSDTGNIHRAGMCLYSPAIRHEARRIG
ncbi:hypothetical protein NB646_04935 [Oxalobacter aliiformigenes]|uniref:Uncharacterized protein n=1 Tax=Oxalobacter aliiformigenes TaxID=2946593 RepID=A0A9E9LFZ7_9BURK|nr:hypothetical protein [Oxalobacter aliiformigenes]WAV92064.1 hypothetical protein NB646_04935 [Oxalobacter aliiformigenes]